MISSTTSTQFRTTVCPGCGGGFSLTGRLMIGEVFGCGRCGTPLEVASIDPLLLELLAKIEEDEEDFVP